MIDDSLLQEWRRLADAATAGPWRVIRDGLGNECGADTGQHGHPGPFSPVREECPTCRLIAAARTALPALLDEVERLRRGEFDRQEHVRELREACDQKQDAIEQLQHDLSVDRAIVRDLALVGANRSEGWPCPVCSQEHCDPTCPARRARELTGK